MCCGRGKSKAKKPSELAAKAREKKTIDGFTATKKSFQNGKRS